MSSETPFETQLHFTLTDIVETILKKFVFDESINMEIARAVQEGIEIHFVPGTLNGHKTLAIKARVKYKEEYHYYSANCFAEVVGGIST